MYSPSELVSLYEQKFSKNNFNENPTTLYEPVNHIMRMKGKRIRPLLLLMSCDMFGGKVEDALNPSFAMEVFHNFTLVHDDIMDQAEIRRGMPTVHTKFGVNAGILAGDVMLAYTYKFLTAVPNGSVPHLLEIFNKTAIEIFEGQQADIDYEKLPEVSTDAYMKMIEFKTSVLLACCLQIGAIMASANNENQKLIYDFGLNLGLAFQIKDDYLDAFGEAGSVGKKIGGDILLNKKTFLLVTAMERAEGAAKAKLQQLLTEKNEQQKIEGIKNIFTELGIKQLTESRIDGLFEKALACLRAVKVADEQKTNLLSFARMIHEREY